MLQACRRALRHKIVKVLVARPPPRITVQVACRAAASCLQWLVRPRSRALLDLPMLQLALLITACSQGLQSLPPTFPSMSVRMHRL